MTYNGQRKRLTVEEKDKEHQAILHHSCELYCKSSTARELYFPPLQA